jgi:RNA polymerase sigma-70 factor (ECF subfamily)
MQDDAPVLDNSRCAALLTASRQGSSEAWGELLQACGAYLLLVANEELDSGLQAKVGASDLVQQTLLEAHQGLHAFRGQTQGAFFAWLRQILLHNLSNCRRHYQYTGKRRRALELSLDSDGSLNGLGLELVDDTTSASARASLKEEAHRLELALEQLPSDYRQVIILRNREHRTFKDIGAMLDRTSDAARMLWYRAFERLVSIMDEPQKKCASVGNSPSQRETE